jgi:hypothetical protein
MSVVSNSGIGSSCARRKLESGRKRKDSERAAFGTCTRCLEIDLIGIRDINREMIVILINV